MKRIIKHLAIIMTFMFIATTCISFVSRATDATAAPAQKAATDAAATEGSKEVHPPKTEIEGKLFTQHLKATLTGEKDGKPLSITEEDELPTTIMTSDILANYSEETGTSTYKGVIDGVATTVTFTFSYDKKGNIVYSAPINYTTPQYTAVGTITGTRKD